MLVLLLMRMFHTVSPVTAPPVPVGCASDYDCPDHAACENRDGSKIERMCVGDNFQGLRSVWEMVE